MISPAAPKTNRIGSIDLLRGIVMIIMVLDHVRDYFHWGAFMYDPTNLSRTTVPIFLTRWITHFCAPIFMLLAGVSARLYGSKRDRRTLARFLLTRGLWLIFAEMFIVTLEWTFNPTYPVFILQVIWAFGACMIVLAGLIYLPVPAILGIGVVLAGAHNLLDGVHVHGHSGWAALWGVLHDQNQYSIGPVSFITAYPIIPWIGILAIGYALGGWYLPSVDQATRRRRLLNAGFAMVVGFVVIRFWNVIGDPSHWSYQKSWAFTVLSFLNTTKYPPSLLYSLMTLGPALIFLALSEKPLGRFQSIVTVYGRTALFFYLVHIPLVHLVAVGAAALEGYPASDMVMIKGWISFDPLLKGYGYPLWVVYLIWIGIVALLYPLCVRFDKYKRGNLPTKPWLSYF